MKLYSIKLNEEQFNMLHKAWSEAETILSGSTDYFTYHKKRGLANLRLRVKINFSEDYGNFFGSQKMMFLLSWNLNYYIFRVMPYTEKPIAVLMNLWLCQKTIYMI